MKIPSHEHWLIYCGDHETYETIDITNLPSHNWRHGYGGIMIFRDPETNLYYSTEFRDSSDDQMTWDDMNYGDQVAHEVVPYEIVQVEYRRKDNGKTIDKD